MTAANLTALRYIKHTGTYGGTPAGNPEMALFPLTRESLELQTDNLSSPTIRADRHTADEFRTGIREIGDIEGVLSYGAYDPLLEYGLYSASWVAADTEAGLTVTVTSGTGTLAATNIGVDVAEGDWIRLSGFVSTLLTNNGWWKVATTSANSITVSGGTGTLVSGTSGATVTRVRGAYLDAGTTASELYIEKEFGGLTSTNRIIASYGCFISKVRMETTRKGFFNCRFSILGANEDVIAATAGDGTPTAVTANIQMNTVDHFIAVVGGAVMDLTQFNMELANNQEPQEVMGTFGPIAIPVGRISVTGDLQAYTEDEHVIGVLNKYHDATEVAFGVVAYDKSSSPSPLGNSYVFDLPANKFRSARNNAEGVDTQVFVRATWAGKTKLEGTVNHMLRIFRFA